MDDLGKAWAEVVKWSAANPLATGAGIAFVVGFLLYIFAYSRLGFFLRLLLGLVTLGLGVFFGWAVLQTFDLAAFTPLAGGVMAAIFVLTLLDDILDGSDWRGNISGGNFRIWDRRE